MSVGTVDLFCSFGVGMLSFMYIFKIVVLKTSALWKLQVCDDQAATTTNIHLHSRKLKTSHPVPVLPATSILVQPVVEPTCTLTLKVVVAIISKCIWLQKVMAPWILQLSIMEELPYHIAHLTIKQFVKRTNSDGVAIFTLSVVFYFCESTQALVSCHMREGVHLSCMFSFKTWPTVRVLDEEKP